MGSAQRTLGYNLLPQTCSNCSSQKAGPAATIIMHFSCTLYYPKGTHMQRNKMQLSSNKGDTQVVAAQANLPDGAGHNGLQHRPSAVMQQMNLVNDHQPHQVGVSPANSSSIMAPTITTAAMHQRHISC
jgi:hypothetical protein